LREKLFAEFCGTFTIVFAPAAIQAFGSAGVTLLNDSLVSGLSVMAMIVAFAEISGAHFNPAVTLWLALEKKFAWKDVPLYTLAQVLGSLAAAGIVYFLCGHTGTGTHVPHIAPLQAIVLEVILTLLLLWTIAGTSGQAKGVSALAIGFLVVSNVLIAGPVTGGSMNPARSLGPALVTGGAALSNYYIYLIGPVLGALIATGVSRVLSGGFLGKIER
jgi:aquaporin NIP